MMLPSRYLSRGHDPRDLLIGQPSRAPREGSASMRARVYVGLCTLAIIVAALLWAGGAPRFRYR